MFCRSWDLKVNYTLHWGPRWPLPLARWIQPTPSHFYQFFPPKPCIYFSCHMCATCPTYLTLLHFIVLIISNKNKKSYSLPLSYKYFPQHPVLEHSQVFFFFNLRDQDLYPYNISTIRVSWILIFVSGWQTRRQNNVIWMIASRSIHYFYLFMLFPNILKCTRF